MCYSFIVNQDYFAGEEAKDKIVDITLEGMTEIGKTNRLSDYNDIMTKNNDGNDTIDDLAVNLENPKNRVYRVGKPTKVEDINQVMGEENYWSSIGKFKLEVESIFKFVQEYRLYMQNLICIEQFFFDKIYENSSKEFTIVCISELLSLQFRE